VSGRFIIINKKTFPLPGTRGRFTHLATIQYGIREFMYFKDKLEHRVYIEEITGGHLERIEDDSLWNSLKEFLDEKGLTQVC